jgi:hypothetical protein
MAKSTPKATRHSRNPARDRRQSEALRELRDSLQRNQLIFVIGTGCSLSLTENRYPPLSWKGLINDGFHYAETKGKITSKQLAYWQPQLESEDLDEILGAAEFMGRKIDAPNGELYSRWLESVFRPIHPTNKQMETALLSLSKQNAPFVTLNYDTLLEQSILQESITLDEVAKVASWMRREISGILHLHGSWEKPASCILGIRDYETTIRSDTRDLIQRSLAAFNRLLFIGCGNTFSDPNFKALIHWLKAKMPSGALQHFALVTNHELSKRHADSSWHGFVEPIPYGEGPENLPEFLQSLSNPIEKSLLKIRPKKTTSQSSPNHSRLIETYKAFLVRDCGQMTIEGVRADMDTAQRRFDLEKLFVPLKVQLCPPEILDKDPNREKKLAEWEQQKKDPIDFGEVFSRHKKIALLALPGGGKTLLLKRLVVAYADPNRRDATKDSLPAIDLVPLLIRCREWRDHIHRPILTLLRDVPDITGQSSLTGLVEALLPLFRKGKILLLVDGLDEIHDDALRSTFVDHLEAFLAEYSRTPIVVTSREAGFNLVAPALSRFCVRWRIAPLNSKAIEELCGHWHRLMNGDSPKSQSDAEELAQILLRVPSLNRLAENPLLLTMLLVVKHGAGRLPPDRVSLYSRAVEVLLDTWNIKGHDPLNPKEAVPQLSFIALQLMRSGKQTATEQTLFKLLDDARERVPQIKRYSKGTPQDFLKRVELRSSLLVEAGRQREGIGTTPFYQFRHLTFQEYLSAIAIVEGHYTEYSQNDTVLVPLSENLLSDEWKEVIPMVAVLARKQAEPLIAALIAEAERKRDDIETNKRFPATESSETRRTRLPAAVARLWQCLIEEAEASPETIANALRLIAFFASLRDEVEIAALASGPYGKDFFQHAWSLYEPMNWPESVSLLNTCSLIAANLHSASYWQSDSGLSSIKELLASNKPKDVAYGLFTLAGLYYINGKGGRSIILKKTASFISSIECLLSSEELCISGAAVRAVGWYYSQQDTKRIGPKTLDVLLKMWFERRHEDVAGRAAYALSTQFTKSPVVWAPSLTLEQVSVIQRFLNEPEPLLESQSDFRAAVYIASHYQKIMDIDTMIRHIERGAALKFTPSRISETVSYLRSLKSCPTGSAEE